MIHNDNDLIYTINVFTPICLETNKQTLYSIKNIELILVNNSSDLLSFQIFKLHYIFIYNKTSLSIIYQFKSLVLFVYTFSDQRIDHYKFYKC